MTPVQSSINLVVFSFEERKPFLYRPSISTTVASASSIIFFFPGGTIKSSIPKESPLRVEYSKPKFLRPLIISAAPSPVFSITCQVMSANFLFGISSLKKGKSPGKTLLKIILPTEVSVKNKTDLPSPSLADAFSFFLFSCGSSSFKGP